MSVNFAPPPHLHLVGRQEKRYILRGATRAAGKRQEAAQTTMGPPLATTRGRHWPMVPALNSGAKFPKSPQPKVVMRAVPRWLSELDESGSWRSSRNRSRPSSAASTPSAARPRSADLLPRGAPGNSAQAMSYAERRSVGVGARAARPASAASASRADRSDVQPAAPDRLLREYRAWKSGEAEWQAPPLELQEVTTKMPLHSSKCMCSGCLSYQPNGLTRLIGAAYC
jgi:hypothetical protein